MSNTLREEITTAINRNCAEAGSNTPDFILAEYLTDCLAAFDKASTAREKWYGKALRIGGVKELPVPPVPGSEAPEPPFGECESRHAMTGE